MVDGEAATEGQACIVSDQAALSKPRYFEDFPVGAVFEFGSITVTEPESKLRAVVPLRLSVAFKVVLTPSG